MAATNIKFAGNVSDPWALLMVTILSSKGWRSASSTRGQTQEIHPGIKRHDEREIFHLAEARYRRPPDQHERWCGGAPGTGGAG